ncbi:TetR family transcriptional regulator [Streptomyces luteolifulvus]|uniref:TetR family transcriptional regulator n=1 Tax=Streptomyces luteolifulvus TaxID=2615112 RepID=A0A6H9UNB6_9ACTN|nr:TetR/AcrR family transcriptional regulator [Streptomyces luteolifulvus]KAB1139566.1 TetR family transcriptional regulator [Streptomyces luteolifulvus]
MAKETRSRMVDAAVEALRQRGLQGMSFTDVLARSGAARGAIYHHFPGGKNQLAAEAVTQHGREVRDRLAELGTADPKVVAAAFAEFARPVARAAAQGAGCAVAAVTVPADEESGELRQAAAATFASWTEQLARTLTEAGLAAADAEEKAALLVALLEGAQVLCRASGSTEPFERAVRATLTLFADP